MRGCRVSVILPVYNAADTVDRALASVAAQSFESWEVRAVDDASTDHSLTILRAWARRDARVHVHENRVNGGAAVARNHALSLARGDYVAFLDADDAWKPQKLARQIAFMEETGAAFTYTGFTRIPVSGGRGHDIRVPQDVTYDQLLYGNVIACQSVVINQRRLGRLAMPNMRRRQDFALWLQLLRRGLVARGLPESLVLKYEQRGSLSSARLRALLSTFQVYRQNGLSHLATAVCLTSHLSRRLMRG